MALDRDTAKDTLFGNFKKQADFTPNSSDNNHPINEAENKHVESEDRHAVEQREIPKWQTLEKITTLLTLEQKDGLDELAKKIMKSRAKDSTEIRERITANTILRALLDNFLLITKNAKTGSIQNEDQLREWIGNLINPSSPNSN
jgi:hypothetical protein